MSETSDAAARFSPEQRERVHEAILGELTRAWDAAVSAGVPAETLASVIAERHRMIQSGRTGDAGASPAVGDDVENGGHDPVNDGRISH